MKPKILKHSCIFIAISQWQELHKHTKLVAIKFRCSGKATKIWKKSPTFRSNFFQIGYFFKFCVASHNIWTLIWSHQKARKNGQSTSNLIKNAKNNEERKRRKGFFSHQKCIYQERKQKQYETSVSENFEADGPQKVLQLRIVSRYLVHGTFIVLW